MKGVTKLKYHRKIMKGFTKLKSLEIVPDSYRYANLVLFLLVAISNSIPCQALAGISPAIAEIYGLSSLEVNANSLFFPIMYVIMILPANYIIDVKGLKLGTLLCQFLMCLGLTVRCLINWHFYFFLFGTFICSLGFCFITSAANRFPNIWFLDQQIISVKSLILFAIFASDSVGFFISTAFISKSSTKSDVQTFFIIQSTVLVIFHVLNTIFFKNLPSQPQKQNSTYCSYSSQIQRQQYCKNLKKLIYHKNYRKLFLSTTFVFSNLSLIFVGIAWLGDAYSISTEQCGYVIVIANAAGLIGCVLSGFLLKDKYKIKCRLLLVTSFFSFIFLWIGFEIEIFWLVCFSSALIGLSIFPFLTTILDFAAQTTFPIGQATSGGSLLFGGQTVGFLMIILFSFYIDNSVTKQKGRVTQGALLCFLIIGSVVLHFSKEDLCRKSYQEQAIKDLKITLASEKQSQLPD